MEAVETTISEHYINKGEARGEARGEAKGEAKNRKEIVRNLLEMGMDTKFISKAIGLSVAEVKRLLAELDI